MCPHGFRTSFRTWAAENRIDRQVAESALAHTIADGVEKAYLGTDIFSTCGGKRWTPGARQF